MTTTAEPPGSLVTQGVRSLEVRWIFPGQMETAVTAALLFAQPLPGGVEPGPDESRSYAEWLYQRPAAESYVA